MHRKFNALIIEPQSQQRGSVLQALRFGERFDSLRTGVSLEKAAHDAEKPPNLDIIFISHRFDPVGVLEFILDMKRLDTCKDAAFILVLPDDESTGAKVGQDLINGLDGFLRYPYSVNSLGEICDLALVVKGQNFKKRMKTGIEAIVSAVGYELDLNARLKNPKSFSERTAEACKIFQRFGEEESQLYFEILIEIMTNPVGRRVFGSLNGKASPQVHELIGSLDDPDARVRAAGAQRLAALERKAAAAVPALLKMLDQESDNMAVHAAIYALIKIGTPESLAGVERYRALHELPEDESR